MTFEAIQRPVRISARQIEYPTSYNSLTPSLLEVSSGADLTMIVTAKPYDNNYFYQSPYLDDGRQMSICSYSGWNDLTNLPVENGVAYFIAQHITFQLGEFDQHQLVTGCINDFNGTKTAVDTGMRSAYICARCLTKVVAGNPLVADLRLLLDAISMSSRLNLNIIDHLPQMLETGDKMFDVFLCHNSSDKPQVRKIRDRLRELSIRTWMDEDQLRPGLSWRVELEKAIPRVSSAAVFVGDAGTGPWQDPEISALLLEFASRSCPVIPVILPDAKEIPTLPLFLRTLTWVDFRDQTHDAMDRLVWGITGQR
ncbi:toll/interleukin-1 receptor domain-containing protein [Mycobacterium asiaticum]|uniref:toll/interleukin-1 receptor domain-containing protein n=1 Tax=Mycobacterium asiaticum TaxID=1790 RepID=UPI001C12AB62|nr:toll/interleukin-1 receptor domain-containing protein [Mycobacterium asiaticum]